MNTKTMPTSKGDSVICHPNQDTVKVKGHTNNYASMISIAETVLGKPKLSVTLPESCTEKKNLAWYQNMKVI